MSFRSSTTNWPYCSPSGSFQGWASHVTFSLFMNCIFAVVISTEYVTLSVSCQSLSLVIGLFSAQEPHPCSVPHRLILLNFQTIIGHLCHVCLSWVRVVNLCDISYLCCCSLPVSSFPNKMVLGRTHIKEVATKRKLELTNYVHNLMRSSTDVTQVINHTHTHKSCICPWPNAVPCVYFIPVRSDLHVLPSNCTRRQDRRFGCLSQSTRWTSPPFIQMFEALVTLHTLLLCFTFLKSVTFLGVGSKTN